MHGISRQESGMNDHVAKPIDMNVLLPTIMKYMCREEKFMLYMHIILLAELYGHMSKILLTYAFYRAII